MLSEKIDASLTEVRKWREKLDQECERLGGLTSENFRQHIKNKAENFKEKHNIKLKQIEKIGLKKIIGSNVTEDKGRLDYEYPGSIAEILPDIESEANEMFNQNSEIKMYPDESDPNRRWWECKDWKVPCGGTHPRNTQEIGNVRLKRKNIGSGKERIEIYLA